MQAETIELLSRTGKFSTEQALILVEAIDQVVEATQFVTVPILDARIATVNTRIDVLEAKLDGRFDSLEAKFDGKLGALGAKFDGKFDALEAKFDGKFDALEAQSDGKFDALEAKFDAKFERWTTRVIIAMVLSQTALGPIGMQVFESLKQVLATLGH